VNFYIFVLNTDVFAIIEINNYTQVIILSLLALKIIKKMNIINL